MLRATGRTLKVCAIAGIATPRMEASSVTRKSAEDTIHATKRAPWSTGDRTIMRFFVA